MTFLHKYRFLIGSLFITFIMGLIGAIKDPENFMIDAGKILAWSLTVPFLAILWYITYQNMVGNINTHPTTRVVTYSFDVELFKTINLYIFTINMLVATTAAMIHSFDSESFYKTLIVIYQLVGVFILGTFIAILIGIGIEKALSKSTDKAIVGFTRKGVLITLGIISLIIALALASGSHASTPPSGTGSDQSKNPNGDDSDVSITDAVAGEVHYNHGHSLHQCNSQCDQWVEPAAAVEPNTDETQEIVIKLNKNGYPEDGANE